eukprot:4482685-Pyramimonas_sp.AAC.1
MVDPDVLPGPREPKWGCHSCGRNANFTSRIRCQCGQAAPRSIIDKAKKRAEDHKQKSSSCGSDAVQRPPRGVWAHGPPVLDKG